MALQKLIENQWNGGFVLIVNNTMGFLGFVKNFIFLQYFAVLDNIKTLLQDGDYNYQIPEQHKTVDYNEKNSSYCQQKDLSFCQNNLCKKCNRNEELKLKKLRELENSVDVSAEQLAQFEKSYDKKYPLCKKCQSSVQNVLFKQNQWLTEYKMLLFKQKSVKRIIKVFLEY